MVKGWTLSTHWTTAQRIMATSALSLGLVPGGIRVIGGHRLRKLCCVGTEILFVDGPRSVDNEGHDTRSAVLRRISDERESCAHLAIDNIVLGSARCMWSLASKDPEHIPIERNMLANLVRWKILARVSDERVDRASELIVSTVPIQTVVSAFIADQFLGVRLGKTFRGPGVVLFLAIHQIATGFDSRQFILANAAEQDFVLSSLGVEVPSPVFVDQRNRQRPVFGPDHQGYCSVRLCHEPMHLLVFDDEAGASIRIFYWVAGGDNILPGRSEDAQGRLFVLCVHCSK